MQIGDVRNSLSKKQVTFHISDKSIVFMNMNNYGDEYSNCVSNRSVHVSSGLHLLYNLG